MVPSTHCQTGISVRHRFTPNLVNMDRLEESANPKGSTVSANVQFEGKAPIKVRYVLTFREGKVVSETWQIDPKLSVAAH